MASRNLELKLAVPDPDALRARVLALSPGARHEGVLVQTDTYFHAPRGRLKLREIGGAAAQLIAYHRPDESAVRGSDYTLVPVPDPALLRTALAATLGVRVVVAKSRELFLWHNVRIHLDAVERLGSFLEFEAVLGDGPGEDEATGAARLDELCRQLHLDPAGGIAGSYSDLLMRGA